MVRGTRVTAKSVPKSKPVLDTEAAFRKVAKTPEGQLVLQWFMSHCGFKTTSLAMADKGLVDPVGTVHNEAKRSVWLFARKLIPWNLLNEIEAERGPTDATTDVEPT